MPEEQTKSHPLLSPGPEVRFEHNLGDAATVTNYKLEQLEKEREKKLFFVPQGIQKKLYNTEQDERQAEQIRGIARDATELDIVALNRQYAEKERVRKEAETAERVARREQSAGRESNFIVRPVGDYRLTDAEARAIFSETVELTNPSQSVMDRLQHELEEIHGGQSSLEARVKSTNDFRTPEERQQLKSLRTEISHLASHAREDWRQRPQNEYKIRQKHRQAEKEFKDQPHTAIPAKQPTRERLLTTPGNENTELSRTMWPVKPYRLTPTPAKRPSFLDQVTSSGNEVAESINRTVSATPGYIDSKVKAAQRRLAPDLDRLNESARGAAEEIDEYADIAEKNIVRAAGVVKTGVKAAPGTVARGAVSAGRGAKQAGIALGSATLAGGAHAIHGGGSLLSKLATRAKGILHPSHPGAPPDGSTSEPIDLTGGELPSVEQELNRARAAFYDEIKRSARTVEVESAYYNAQRGYIRGWLEDQKISILDSMYHIFFAKYEMRSQAFWQQFEQMAAAGSQPLEKGLDLLDILNEMRNSSNVSMYTDAISDIYEKLVSLIQQVGEGDVLRAADIGRTYQNLQDAQWRVLYEGNEPSGTDRIEEILHHGFYPGDLDPRIQKALCHPARVRFSRGTGGTPPSPPIPTSASTPLEASEKKKERNLTSIPEEQIETDVTNQYTNFRTKSILSTDEEKRTWEERQVSPTLKQNPQALLDRQEIPDYFRRQNPKYLEKLEEYMNQQGMSVPMEDECEAIVCVPVYTLGEGKVVQHALEQYLYQIDPGKNKNAIDPRKFEIILFLNHPETKRKELEKQLGQNIVSGSEERVRNGKPEAYDTEEVVSQFMNKHAELRIRVMKEEFEERVLWGQIIKPLYDAALARSIQREHPTHPDPLIITNDIDLVRMSPQYIKNITEYFESVEKNKQMGNQKIIDGIVGKIDLAPEGYQLFPELLLSKRFHSYLELQNTQFNHPTHGRNTIIKGSTLAAIGGPCPYMDNGADGEMGGQIFYARGQNATTIPYLHKAWLETDPRRELKNLEHGRTLAHNWDTWSQMDVYGKSWTELNGPSFDPDNINKDNLEAEINQTIQHPWYRHYDWGGRLERALSFIGLRNHESELNNVIQKGLSQESKEFHDLLHVFQLTRDDYYWDDQGKLVLKNTQGHVDYHIIEENGQRKVVIDNLVHVKEKLRGYVEEERWNISKKRIERVKPEEDVVEATATAASQITPESEPAALLASKSSSLLSQSEIDELLSLLPEDPTKDPYLNLLNAQYRYYEAVVHQAPDIGPQEQAYWNAQRAYMKNAIDEHETEIQKWIHHCKDAVSPPEMEHLQNLIHNLGEPNDRHIIDDCIQIFQELERLQVSGLEEGVTSHIQNIENFIVETIGNMSEGQFLFTSNVKFRRYDELIKRYPDSIEFEGDTPAPDDIAVSVERPGFFPWNNKAPEVRGKLLRRAKLTFAHETSPEDIH